MLKIKEIKPGDRGVLKPPGLHLDYELKSTSDEETKKDIKELMFRICDEYHKAGYCVEIEYSCFLRDLNDIEEDTNPLDLIFDNITVDLW